MFIKHTLQLALVVLSLSTWLAPAPDGTFYASTPINGLQGTSNTPPVANDDHYSIDQGQILSVPPAGILENDEDPDFDLLSAFPKEGPRFGKLDLNSDGSFTYTPEPGFAGRDSYTYHANDFETQSAFAVVEIMVQDTAGPTVQWISPVSTSERYDVVQEKIRLEVESHDNVAVDRVLFFRWDALQNQFLEIGEVKQAPYAIVLDAGSLNLEWNQVFARSYDPSGNVSDRQFVWIYREKPPTKLYLPLALH